MKLKYTKHAEKKFIDLKSYGIIVKKAQISDAIHKPEFHILDNGTSIVASGFDKNHNLRVVYKKSKSDIIVITFYIYKKGRYDEN